MVSFSMARGAGVDMISFMQNIQASVTNMETVITSRIYEDVWSVPSSRARHEGPWKDKLRTAYGNLCMVTGVGGADVVDAHIFPQSKVRFLKKAVPSLNPSDIWSVRNGLRLIKAIETNFDELRLTFICLAPLEIPASYEVKILDPLLAVDRTPITGTSICWRDLNGKRLNLPSEGVRPFARLLNFHVKASVSNAFNTGWLDSEERASILLCSDIASCSDATEVIEGTSTGSQVIVEGTSTGSQMIVEGTSTGTQNR